jgi:misacylated tRNA(Ala) deacylase
MLAYAAVMTESIAVIDAYARSCTATVLASGPDGVVLERTVFYPGGGGQPADSGILRTDAAAWTVTGARKSGPGIVHAVEPAQDESLPEVGSTLRVEIDWERRHRLMRTHSALHVLCGVIWRDHGAQVTGGNMEPLAGRMDFEFETMHGDLVAEIEARVNEEIAADREIRVAHLPRDEAFKIPDLIRTKINLLPQGISEVRTIDIVGLDLQADGGTHVARTSEIGRVRVTGYESKGRINKRIRIAIEDA